MMKRGIDVSTYQRDIDWAQVKADGIDFAMIKATQGRSEVTASLRNFTDSKFAQNIVGANRWGIRVGVYHFLTAKTVSESMQEAEYFLSVIAPYKSIVSLWAVVDVESKYLPEDKALLTQIVHTFCSRVQAEGYQPMVYTNPDWLKNRLNDVSHWDLWLALWRNKQYVPTAEQFPNLHLWQYGSEAVDGIVGDVDSNFMIADIETEKTEDEIMTEVNSTKQNTSKKDNTPAAWAEEAVEWAVENKILLGDQNGDLMLHQSLTREQACLVAKRIYDRAVEDAAQKIALKLLSALK